MTHADSQLCAEDEFDDVHPWRRYFARHTDICLIILFCMVLYNMFPDYFNAYSQFVRNKHYIHYLVVGLVIMIFNAACLSLTGTTLGKFLFSIRIVNIDRKRLNFFYALYREFLIVVLGLAFYIPIIIFFTSYFSYVRLTTTGNTRWDTMLSCTVVHLNSDLKQKIYHVIGVILYVSLSFLLDAITRRH